MEKVRKQNGLFDWSSAVLPTRIDRVSSESPGSPGSPLAGTASRLSCFSPTAWHRSARYLDSPLIRESWMITCAHRRACLLLAAFASHGEFDWIEFLNRTDDAPNYSHILSRIIFSTTFRRGSSLMLNNAREQVRPREPVTHRINMDTTEQANTARSGLNKPSYSTNPHGTFRSV